MPRAICWECGRQLVILSGKVVYDIITDSIGNEHKVHKACREVDTFEKEQEKIKVLRQSQQQL